MGVFCFSFCVLGMGNWEGSASLFLSGILKAWLVTVDFYFLAHDWGEAFLGAQLASGGGGLSGRLG